MAVNRGRKVQTGTASAFGGAKLRKSKTLNPWGKAIPQATARGANSAGVTKARTSAPAGSAVRRPTPSPQEAGMDYAKNDPTQWPIQHPTNHSQMARKSGMTQHKVDVNNAVVNKAYTDAGYS